MTPQSLEEVRTGLVVCSCNPRFPPVENSIGRVREQRQALDALWASLQPRSALLSTRRFGYVHRVCTLCAQRRHWRRQRQGSPATQVSCARGFTASQQCTSHWNASAVPCAGCKKPACCWHAASGRLMHRPRLTDLPALSAAPTEPASSRCLPPFSMASPPPTHRARQPSLAACRAWRAAPPALLAALPVSVQHEWLHHSHRGTGQAHRAVQPGECCGHGVRLHAGRLPVAAGC